MRGGIVKKHTQADLAELDPDSDDHDTRKQPPGKAYAAC